MRLLFGKQLALGQAFAGFFARNEAVEPVEFRHRGTVDAAVRLRPTLSDEQTAMVRRLTRDGHGVQVVTGKAGTGKTFALDAAREAWQTEGHVVIGAAVARRAARELEDGAGIESTSLAALLQDLHAGGEMGLPDRAVVVVDEASMAGTRDLAELLEYADAAHSKVVLVGDPHQLPEIDAGGAFRALITRTNLIELTQNRRQEDAWERETLDLLREGNANEALARYERHGRVVLGEGAEDVRARLVADWWKAAGDGDAAMIAMRRDDVADLNRRARALMRASGHLAPDALRIGDRAFAVGDHVVTLKNARHLGVVNGTRGVVTGFDAHAVALAVRTSDGCDVTLPRSYLEARTERSGRTLDHGYAITGHKAQGMTTGKAYVLGTDDLYREWGYVAMSRGSVENHLYVVAPRARERDEYAPEEKHHDPLDALIASLEYSHAQTAALDVAAREGIGQMTTTDLVVERTFLEQRIGTAAPAGRSARLERLRSQQADAEHAAAEARRRVHNLEGRGAARHGRRGGNADPLSAERALEAQAEERVLQLRAREELIGGSPRNNPPGIDPQDVARYKAIEDELDRRRRARVRVAQIEKAEYLVRELGPYPRRRSERHAWDRAASRVEKYRYDFDISDQQQALGPEPRERRERAVWQDARRDIDRAQSRLSWIPLRSAHQERELR